MPSINMIAPRRAEKRRIGRDMRRLILVIVGELVCAVALGGWVCTKMLTTGNRITSLNAQLATLEPVVKQIEDYDKATKSLKPKMDLLNQAKEETMRWYSTLDRLTQSMPQSTYLTRVATKMGDKSNAGTVLNLAGVSVSQTRIGEAMLRLAEIPDVDKIDLHFTQSSTVAGCPAVEFEIGATMKSGQPSKGVKSNGRVQS